ncbi:MAG: phosphoribosylamine--glycine ligase N-terminal domain-containing protein, partial [Clostridiales bacterium]
MKIMVIGGGGREHTLIKKIAENPRVSKIFALPGNGGIAQEAICVPIGAKDVTAIVAFAQQQQIDFAV